METVHLREKQLGFCKGCLACLKLGRCVIQDDAVEIAAKMHDADVLVFATPVYYYSVCGQLKTMLDRANPLFGSDYAFTEAYLLATAAEDGRSTFDGAKKAGMEIKDIRLFMEWCAEGPSTYPKRKAMFEERKAHMESEIANMNRALDMLKFKCWYYEQAIQDGNEDRVKALIPDNLPEEIKDTYDNAHTQ